MALWLVGKSCFHHQREVLRVVMQNFLSGSTTPIFPPHIGRMFADSAFPGLIRAEFQGSVCAPKRYTLRILCRICASCIYIYILMRNTRRSVYV